MSFTEVEKKLSDWLSENSDFKLIFANSDERRFDISSSYAGLETFYIICPKPIGGKWMKSHYQFFMSGAWWFSPIAATKNIGRSTEGNPMLAWLCRDDGLTSPRRNPSSLSASGSLVLDSLCVDTLLIQFLSQNRIRSRCVHFAMTYYVLLSALLYMSKGHLVVSSECSTMDMLTAAQQYCTTSADVCVDVLLKHIKESVQSYMDYQESSADGGKDDDDDDEDNDGYYGDSYGPDNDCEMTPVSVLQSAAADDDDRITTVGTNPAAHRLMMDFKAVQKSQKQFGFLATPHENNIYVWDVKLFDFPDDSLLGKDLAKYSEKYKREKAIQMELSFPSDYPMNPPFVRIIRPKFKFLTGHVTIGGSICMEMLTRSGWSPSNDIESILVQIRSAIMSDPNAQLDGSDHPYSVQEAKEAFHRMVAKYGWNK